jgi:hypothetical protein
MYTCIVNSILGSVCSEKVHEIIGERIVCGFEDRMSQQAGMRLG